MRTRSTVATVAASVALCSCSFGSPASGTPTADSSATLTSRAPDSPTGPTNPTDPASPAGSGVATASAGAPGGADVPPLSPPAAVASLFPQAAAAPSSAIPSRGGITLLPLAKGRLTGKRITVDAGHNGRQAQYPAVINALVPAGNGKTKACNTTGTASRTGYPEHAHNWSVALTLVDLLRRQGATVTLTRPNDAGVGPCVNERAAIGNRTAADLVLSIHADGAPASGRGFHVITSPIMAGGSKIRSRSVTAATIVRDTFAAVTKMPRSTYTGSGRAMTSRTDLAGLNLSTAVAVMLEAGNMANPTDDRLLRSPAFRQREAQALAAAALKILG